MRVERVDDPGELLERAGPMLLEDEARHNLILGIAGNLRDRPAAYAEYFLWLVEDEAEILGAALLTPPFNLVLARPRFDHVVPVLARVIHAEGVVLPGVTASLPEAEAFAGAWETVTGQRRRRRVAQRIYRATEIDPPSNVTGSPRAATQADRALLVEWVRAFLDEASAEPDRPAEQPERTVDARIEHGAGGFVLWEHGADVVSLAGWGGRTPNGVRIGPVYTPPEHRGRGYGSAVTAAVSSEQLASGRRFCFLYTDLANPTSNKIYVDIGYEAVCDSVEYAFEER